MENHGRKQSRTHEHVVASEPANDSEEAKLREARLHFGDEPHYFWVNFDEKDGPQLLSVPEVWEAHRRGRKALAFRPAPLDASQRNLLKFLSEGLDVGND